MCTNFIIEDKKFFFTIRTLVRYIGEDVDVIVPEDVACIGKRAFADCTHIKTVVLPDRLREIEDNAFEGCTELEKINIPNRFKYAGNGVFDGCTKLKKIILTGNEIPGEKSEQVRIKSSLGQAILSYCKEMCTPVTKTLYGTKHIEIRKYPIAVDPWTGDSWLVDEETYSDEYEIVKAGPYTVSDFRYLYSTEEEVLKDGKEPSHGLKRAILGEICFDEYIFSFIVFPKYASDPYSVEVFIRKKGGNPNIYKKANRAELCYLSWMMEYSLNDRV